MRAVETQTEPKNPLDLKMTPAQVARRRFKSGLPRKLEERSLSPLEALAQLLTYVERFRAEVLGVGGDPDKEVHAGLAYFLPQSDPHTLAAVTRPLPTPLKIGKFCDEVLALYRPVFLGVVFIHVDAAAKKSAHETVSFAVPFAGGAEAASRLLFAQKLFLSRVGKLLPGAGN